MKGLVVLTHLFLFVQGFSYSSDDIYGQSHVNFNEIFTNSLSLINDENMTPMNKDDEFQMMSSIPSAALSDLQEFGSATTTPKPRYPKKKDIISTSPAGVLEINSTTIAANTTTSTTARTTTTVVSVLPLTSQPRGMLDLLFPASRVKGFKNMFDTFRRMLSYTFKK